MRCRVCRLLIFEPLRTTRTVPTRATFSTIAEHFLKSLFLFTTSTLARRHLHAGEGRLLILLVFLLLLLLLLLLASLSLTVNVSVRRAAPAQAIPTFRQ